MNIPYEKGEFTIVPNKSKLKGLPASTQSVYHWICSYSDRFGQCFPSRSTLAKDAGVSVRTVDGAIAQLVAYSLLSVMGRKKEDSVENLTNIYQILVALDGEMAALGGGVESAPPSATVAQRTQPTQLNPLLELNGAFEHFWKLYPRKVGKRAASIAFVSAFKRNKAIDPNVLYDTITVAVAKQSLQPSWNKEAGAFIPHAQTWLNQERWNDEINIEAQKQAVEAKKQMYIKGDKAYEKDGKLYVITHNGSHCEYGGSKSDVEWR